MAISTSVILPEHVVAIWSKVVGYIKLSTDYSYGRFEPEDVLDLILEGRYLLWIAYEGSDIKGAVVTSVVQYPRKKFLYLMFCGGEDGFDWKEEMLKMLQCWAFDSQCDGIEANGRLGWSKIFKADGYKPLWQLFELPAGEAGLGA